MTSRPGPELQDLIGETAFVRLAEAFGGTRLYVPQSMGPDHAIVAAIGAAAAVLAERMAPDVIHVPLAREARARHYRGVDGLSNDRIALALGMTESGIRKLFQRMDEVPAKGSVPPSAANDDSDQPDFFKRR